MGCPRCGIMRAMSIIRHGIATFFVLALLTPVVVAAAPSAPFVRTLSPTFVTEKDAQLNGAVNSAETRDTYQWFEWGISGRSEVYETKHNSIRSSTVLVNTNTEISGLAPNTLYFYRQIAENGHGKTVGATTYFTTKPLPQSETPVLILETRDASAIGETNAILNGYVSPHGNPKATWWFEWGKTRSFGQSTRTVSVGFGSRLAQTRITDLESGTRYYFRIVGENSDRVYGSTKSFLTREVTGAQETILLDLAIEGERTAQIKQLQSHIIALLRELVAELEKELAKPKTP